MKSFLRRLLCTTVALLVIGASGLVAATVDNFSDLNDTVNPTWTHLNLLVGSTGQTWNASTGEYQLKAPTNGASLPPAGQLGWVGSITGPISTDVSVSADIVEPTGNPTDIATGYLLGVLARSNGVNAVAGTTGYVFGYNQSGQPGTPRIEITKIKPGAQTAVVAASAAIAPLDFLNRNYTLSLTGIGDTWTGNLFEVGNAIPIATTSGTDVNVGGIAPYTSGFSGVFGLSLSLAGGPIDVTFDNFSTADVPEPTTVLLVVLGAAMLPTRRRFRR